MSPLYRRLAPQEPPTNGTGLQIPGPAQDKNRNRIAMLWGGSLPIMAGDPAWRYLVRHGLHANAIGDLRAVLRYHPSLEYWETAAEGLHARTSTHPGLLAAVRPANHSSVLLPPVLLRVYLTPQGDLAPVGHPHKHTGAHATWRGSAIQLGEPCQQAGQWVLAVTVGLENALRVHACTGLPVWAVTDENALKGLSFPRTPRINRLQVFTDTPQALPVAELTRKAAACAIEAQTYPLPQPAPH